MDVSRHFSYYAWEGGAGSLRWKHEVRQNPKVLNPPQAACMSPGDLCS